VGYEEEITDTVTIQRSTYFLAGQAVATRISGDPDPDKNGLFFLHSDHLGSNSFMSYGAGHTSGTAGAMVLGTLARYLPFGDWRAQPSADLTDIGFTGHKGNNLGSNDIGLIYMNARYFVGSIGRFASADTIVPDPTNPQSYNRYAYGYNNPLRFTDPTGHCVIEDDLGGQCTPMPPPSLATPLVDFTAVNGQVWTAEEKATVQAGAWQVAKTLYGASDGQFSSPRQAFLGVYGSTVTFHKTGTFSEYGNLGFANSQNEILVYNHASGSVISEGARWVAHELGHAFDKALHPNTTDDRDYGQGTIDLATSDIGLTNERGNYVPIAGGCNAGNYLTSCYIRRSGYDAGYVDEFNVSPTPMEDFADMFSGYAFGFADNAAGQARYGWMDSQMSAWINLAVTNNNR
jgi:RHS repeat-associated protein